MNKFELKKAKNKQSKPYFYYLILKFMSTQQE